MIKFLDINGKLYIKKYEDIILKGYGTIYENEIEVYDNSFNYWYDVTITNNELRSIINQIKGEMSHGKNQGIIKKSLYAFRSFSFRFRRLFGFQK